MLASPGSYARPPSAMRLRALALAALLALLLAAFMGARPSRNRSERV